VAIASFVKWLSSQQTETKSRENQTEGDPILYPYGLLAFICLLVFAGVVVGALTNWSGTFWLAVVAIVATTSTFWANVVFAVIASKREKRGGGAHHKPRH